MVALAHPRACLVLGLLATGLAACGTDQGPTKLATGPGAGGQQQSLPPDPEKIEKTFQRTASANAQFAKKREPHTFYMALAVKDLRDQQDSGVCTDTSVLSWLRKQVAPGARDIAVVGSVADPAADAAVNIPLFAAAKDETQKSTSCGTTVLNRTITPYYLSDRTHPFAVTVNARASNATNVAAAKGVVSLVDTVLTYTGKNGSLIKIIGGNQVGAIASAIDSSLSQNYSQVSTNTYEIQISAFPDKTPDLLTDADWTAFKDAAEFGAPEIQATVWGPRTDGGVRPAFLLYPTYALSMFGDGPGHYYSAERVMGEPLLPANQGALRDLLLAGIGGVNTKSAQNITDAGAMNQFCKDTRDLLVKFLTDDDVLAVQYSVLKESTNYFHNISLRQAPDCLSDDQIAHLKELRADYTLPDLESGQVTGRHAVIDRRTSTVAHAILNAGAPGALNSVIPDPTKFQLVVAGDVAPFFPSPPDGKGWGGIGQTGVDQLAKLGLLKIGCGRAPPGKSAKMVAGLALTRFSSKPVPMIMFFANDDPAPGAEAQEKPVLVAIKFYPTDTVKDLTGLTDWSSDSCDLI